MSKMIALNFTAPLQSWAGKSLIKTQVYTNLTPEDRAIRGLIAACFGVPRGVSYPSIISNAKICFEVIRPGSLVRDYQIISPRPGEEEFISKIGRIIQLGTKQNKMKVLTANNEGKSSIVNRTYLADAQILVFIQGKDSEDTSLILDKIYHPIWSPYLGKKAFSPTFPFILGLVDSESKVEDALQIINTATQDKEAYNE